MGIGRPSTYAAIISTIQDRGYVKQEKRAFYATELGTLVTEKLIEHFPKIMDVKFTSHMEDELDKIEDGKIVWLDVLKEFYEPFKNDLERAVGEMKSVKGTPEESTKVCTVCGQPMVIRWGKHGKFLGCSAFPKCKSTLPLDEKGEPAAPEATDQKCEKCGSAMVVKTEADTENFLRVPHTQTAKIQNRSLVKQLKLNLPTKSVKNAAVSWSFGPARRADLWAVQPIQNAEISNPCLQG